MNFKYDLDIYLKPFNNNEIMYFETALPLKGEAIQTLFPIEEIIAVTNYGLDVIYEEGKDYIVKDKKLVITENSKIKQIGLDEYYSKKPAAIQINVNKERARYKFNDQRYLMFGELDFMSSKQIAITYKHKLDDVAFVQKNQKNQLGHFFNKLENKQNPTIVFYGDSITEGNNSSGTQYGNNTKPYAPSWTTMVTDYLERYYNAKINYVNTAVGGKNTKWGLDNVEERVNKYHPDLFIMGLGANDGMLSKEDHAALIKEIIDSVRKENPECDIILIATIICNPESEWYCGQQQFFYQEYEKFDYNNLAICNMTLAHFYLLSRKAFKDMSGNNINHPNDFLARVYAQAILQVMGLIDD